MEFKHKRGNCLILFEKVTEMPMLILGIFFSAFLVKNLDKQALIPVVFILLSPISRLISYLFTFYTLSDNLLIVESGVFTKKRTEIPFSTITTVDLSQNILFQFFKVYKIKVDNASQTNEVANKSNVNLTLKIDEAILFKQIITNNKIEIVEEKVCDTVEAQTQDFVKLGLLQSKFAYFFSIIAVAGSLIGAIVPNYVDKNPGVLIVTALILASIIVIYLISIGMSIIKCVVTYYNFKVWKDDDTLKVQYGLLNKKSYSLQRGKINGIILKQSLLMKLCKLYTAEVIVIGYGDRSKEGGTEQAIIFPIASIDKIKEIVNKVLPEYSLDYNLCKPDRKALRYFFFSPVFFFTIIGFSAALVISTLINNYIVIAVAFVFLVVAVFAFILKYINSGISVGLNNVVLSAGTYSKTIAIIKTKSIESITASGSIFKRRKGIVSVKLGFIAPLRVSNITSLNLPAKQFDLLEEVLKY